MALPAGGAGARGAVSDMSAASKGVCAAAVRSVAKARRGPGAVRAQLDTHLIGLGSVSRCRTDNVASGERKLAAKRGPHRARGLRVRRRDADAAATKPPFSRQHQAKRSSQAAIRALVAP